MKTTDAARVSGTPQPDGSAEIMAARFRESKPRQCVACGKQAKRIYGYLTHTDAVICSKRCGDAFIPAMVEEPNKTDVRTEDPPRG